MAARQLLAHWVLAVTLSVALPAASGALTDHLNISDPGEGTAQIVGGSVAGKHEFPFIVSIRDKNGAHWCGGSIIAPEWVLTEAYCIGADAATYTIVAGAYNFDHPNPHSEQTVRVAAFFWHPNYNTITYANDIGLIRVTPPFHLNGHSVATIRLPSPASHYHLSPPEKAIIAGWGQTTNDGPPRTRVLRNVTVQLVQDDICRQIYQYVPDTPAAPVRKGLQLTPALTRVVHFVNPALQVCYYGSGRAPCSGDDGGPLFVAGENGHGGLSDFRQVGIVSTWYLCESSRFPGIYTRLSAFTTWIETTIEEANHEK